MDRLGVEWLCVSGLTPPDLITLTADAGCRFCSLLPLSPAGFNPHNYPLFSLLDDKAMVRETKARMADRGVSISLGEGCAIYPDTQFQDYEPHLEVMAELGVTRINTLSFDSDRARGLEQIDGLISLARRYGATEFTLEFIPGFTVATMTEGLQFIQDLGQPDFRLLIDTMHLVRSGATTEELATVNADMVGYIQLCDGPLVATNPDYLHEAMTDRGIPGSGEYPLVEIMKALPRDTVVGVEVPLDKLAAEGVPPLERVRRTVEGARQILAQLD